MSFICTYNICAIALSKATFPVIMDCPVCGKPLVPDAHEFSLTDDDIELIAKLPYVIAYPLKRTLFERNPWTRINLFKDTFLNYLKYLGLVTASEFFNSSIKDKKMVALFQQALAEPSFGSWNQYIRETLNYLKENNHHFFCPDLLAYYELVETGKKRKLFKGEIEFIDGNGDVQLKQQEATAIGMLINFRNRYLGHGLTLDEKESQKIWDEYFPIFRKLLEDLTFGVLYPMYKYEHGESYKLQSPELIQIEKRSKTAACVWMENLAGDVIEILPFFIVPGEVSVSKEDKEQIFTYESYTGKTIKFFSPEGTEKQTSGKVLEKLNLLLRDKQKEQPHTPDSFTREVFINRIADENKLILDTLTAEKKYIPGVYVHREEMEIKLREWIGARANIFFIAAEAGSGKTNLLLEIQNQYTKQNFPVLFIRVARMEKKGIWEQLAYLLNIQTDLGIESYTALSGTQAAPTFILIDGLNEAPNAEQLWNEIIQLSQKTNPGSVKFVVTSRANTSADLNRFVYTDAEEKYLYGDKKEGHTGLSAYAFWLTALNMAEMKDAWDNYVKTDKNKYKPQFSFDALATFDRALYTHISNPLVLRIFLETYQNKPLPKKGNKHLNIWHDWLASFSEDEIRLMKVLAQAVWDKGENELLLDDLLNNPSLKPFLTTDLINAPYPRLKNLGWISRYTKDLITYLSFTVEGFLLYLMGKQLVEQNRSKDFDAVKSLLKSGTKIQQSAVEVYLSQLALACDLELVCELIDAGEEYHYACNAAMLVYLRSYGVKLFIDKIFSEPSDNDWKAMLKLNKTLDDLQEHNLNKQLLDELLLINKFNSKSSILLGLKACAIIDDNICQKYLEKIDLSIDLIVNDIELLIQRCSVDIKLSQYENALLSIQNAHDYLVAKLGKEHTSISDLYELLGVLWWHLGNYEKALEFSNESRFIRIKLYGEFNQYVSYSYVNAGSIFSRIKEYDRALELYQKGLDIQLKIYGENHTHLAVTYINIAGVLESKFEGEIIDKVLEYLLKANSIFLKNMVSDHQMIAISFYSLACAFFNKKEYDISLEYFQKSLKIELKIKGDVHIDVINLYESIGQVFFKKCEYELSLNYFQKSLNIYLELKGEIHPKIAALYFGIGECNKETNKFEIAIDAFSKGSFIAQKFTSTIMYSVVSENIGGFSFQIAVCYEAIGKLQDALVHFIESAIIRNEDTECGIEDKSTIESIQNTIRVAKLIGKENELPEWIKNHNK